MKLSPKFRLKLAFSVDDRKYRSGTYNTSILRTRSRSKKGSVVKNHLLEFDILPLKQICMTSLLVKVFNN